VATRTHGAVNEALARLWVELSEYLMEQYRDVLRRFLHS
jgi:hypothetical protein